MNVRHLPDALQTRLAAITLDTILTYRLANAAKIDEARQAVLAQRHAAAATLLSTKPVPNWTPEDHLIFMDASGDIRLPPAFPPPPAPAVHVTPATDLDIPF